MEAEKCRVCGTSDQLLPRWMSDTGHKWVHCDRCGNTSKPVASNDRNEIITQWNREQIDKTAETGNC